MINLELLDVNANLSDQPPTADAVGDGLAPARGLKIASNVPTASNDIGCEVTMSFLGNVVGGFLGKDSQQMGVAQALLSLLQEGHGGGLSGLVQRFQANGLGGPVDSWVGTGANQAISPDQAEQGFGSDQLQHLASRAGISPSVARVALAAILPSVIDQLTPDGKIPTHQTLVERLASILTRQAA